MIKQTVFFLGILGAVRSQDGCKAPAFLNSAQGAVESPYYAYPTLGGYPNNLRCRWVITNPANNNLSVTFAESFAMEQSSSCSYDKVVFFNGVKTGQIFCTSLNSSEGQLAAGTDGSQSGQGFHLSFSATDEAATAVPTETTTPPPVTGPTSPGLPLQANFTITLNESGNRTVYVTSPNYPNQYPNYLNYQWTISTTSATSYIQVTAEDFELENSCNYDRLTILDPASSSDPSFSGVEYCGTTGPHEIRSAGKQLLLSFTTDGSGQYRGFRLRVELTKCKENEYSCPNDPNHDTCFSPDMLCDGRPDCPDGEDENCPLTCGNPSIQPWLSTKTEELQEARIVGGIEARPHSFPWHVAIYSGHSNAKDVSCGGTIIDHHFVLTTSDCCSSYSTNPTGTGLHIGVGEHSLTGSREPHALNYTVQKSFIHPRMSHGPLTNAPLNNPSYDYCLLKTEMPIFFNDHVIPACLGMMEYPDNTRCYFPGWGLTGGAGQEDTRSPVLRQVDLRVVSPNRCRSLFAQQTMTFFPDTVQMNLTNVIGPENMCAGTPGKGGCLGDRGGALVCQNPSDRQTWYAVGLFSSSFGCGDATPAIFSRVSNAMEWISSVMFSEV